MFAIIKQKRLAIFFCQPKKNILNRFFAIRTYVPCFLEKPDYLHRLSGKLKLTSKKNLI